MGRMNFSFSEGEIKDIIWSTLAVGFILSYREFTLLWFLKMTIVVALSFIPHEMAHKFVAQKYGCFARYEMWKSGLIFAIILTFVIKFAIIAPGVVAIYPGVRRAFIGAKENAYISAAGPMTNIMLGLLFLPLASVNEIFWLVVYINGILTVFNLLPVPPLDGSKIIWYNILGWGVMMAAGVMLVGFAIGI